MKDLISDGIDFILKRIKNALSCYVCYPGLGFRHVTERSYAFSSWAETAEQESMSMSNPGFISPSHLLKEGAG